MYTLHQLMDIFFDLGYTLSRSNIDREHFIAQKPCFDGGLPEYHIVHVKDGKAMSGIDYLGDDIEKGITLANNRVAEVERKIDEEIRNPTVEVPFY